MKLDRNTKNAITRSIMDATDRTEIDAAEEAVIKMVMDYAINSLPPAVKKIAMDKSLSHYMVMTNVYVGHSVRSFSVPWSVATSKFGYSGTHHRITGLPDLCSKVERLATARNELRSRVETAVYSCSTRKQLVDRFPEWEKFCPSDERAAAKFAVVDQSLMPDLKKAGFPGGKRKAAVPIPTPIGTALADEMDVAKAVGSVVEAHVNG